MLAIEGSPSIRQRALAAGRLGAARYRRGIRRKMTFMSRGYELRFADARPTVSVSRDRGAGDCRSGLIELADSHSRITTIDANISPHAAPLAATRRLGLDGSRL